MSQFQMPKIVTQDEWLKARLAHLKSEKALTRMRDLVARERRTLPWVKVEKTYTFDSLNGKQTLAELFGTNSQLIVYHFMLGPNWDAGCTGCSFAADHAEGALIHLQNHDVSYVQVSQAPLEKIEAYRKRMGWKTKWVSSYGSDFNFDFNVSFKAEDMVPGKMVYNYRTIENEKEMCDELPGMSVFYKDDAGSVYHTYSSYARGNEEVIGTFIYLDATPKGRNETEIMDWVKRHDEYDEKSESKACDHC